MYKIIGGDGREYGPASAEEVRQWLAQGRIHYHTLACGPGDLGWRPLHSYAELIPPAPVLTARAASAAPYNPLALWGFICGVLSFLGSCFCCCGCPVNFLAIVLSALGLAQALREKDSPSQTLALVGLVLGILTTLVSVFSGLVAGLIQIITHAAR